MAEKIYKRLKTDLSQAYFSSNMVVNLEHFREEASGDLVGPGQSQDLTFLQICKNLEGKGVIGYDKLDKLKGYVESAPVGSTQMCEKIEQARTDIQKCLSGNNVKPSETYRQPGPEAAASGGAGNFHKTDNTTLSFDTIQAMGKSDMNKSVGIIKIDINGEHADSGTGFRFGKYYVMTAYHVVEEIVTHIWSLIISKVERRPKKESIYQKMKTMISRPLADIKSGTITPNRQGLPFGKLFAYLHEMGVPVEVFDEKWKKAVTIEFGVKKGEATAGKFNFEYDIAFADKIHDVAVLQISKDCTDLPPPMTLEKFTITDKVHLVGYPKGSTEVDLRSDIECTIYTDNGGLCRDVKEAVEWWKKEKGRSVENHYAVCRYVQHNRTDTGKMFLHTSKQFEHRSSGCPAVAIINGQPVVQLMYLRGYPEFCYEEQNYPPLQYLFEAGVSMPVVTQLLEECCPETME